ncbi:hypothetical protein [Rhodopirellula sp. MGV]|uniref:hypothetical protein n=1 Tax=Rhodopirellula sp. MGV TaxID=2023130 RepID=UPI000B95FBD6|nr:hypothetical protein [Rhodopirellula sp. MGV]OYP34971.1 hypothetical protein CGZ80_13200 [Rhodopirellula sp. MGV]PNY38133.1 hypothetical protein C2E31_03745 [Rhodopirellula baltica]
MQLFRQTCPHCQATLELPIEASGKRSLCPGCEREFVAERVGVSSVPHQDDRSIALERPLERVSIETLFADTMAIVSLRRRDLYLPAFVLCLGYFLLVVIPLSGLNVYAQTNLRSALIWLGIATPFFCGVNTYVIAILIYIANRTVNASSSEEPASNGTVLKSSFKPGWPLFRQVATFVLLATFIASVLVVATGLMFNQMAAATIQLMLLLFAFAFAVSIIAPVLIAMMLWPMLPLCDRPMPLLVRLRRTFRIAAHSLFNSFLISVAITFLLGIGLGLMGIGLIITAPIAALLLVVAQRRTEGESIRFLDEQ